MPAIIKKNNTTASARRVSNKKFLLNKNEANYPSIRKLPLAQSPQFGLGCYASRPMSKTAQTGLTGGGSTTTPPSFYSPQHTPSAWQIPTTRKEVYAWAKYWIDNEPIIAAAIDFYSNFPISKYEIVCESATVREYYEDLLKKLDIDKWFPDIAREYWSFGDVFILLDLECPECNGSGINQTTNKPCAHNGATWSKLSILDPNMVDVEQASPLLSESVVSVTVDEQLQRVCATRQPAYQYERLASIPGLVEKVLSGQPIILDPIAVTHLKCNASPYSTYGSSIVRRLYTTLAYKDKLRQAQWMVAERHILPIKIVKIGSDGRPASPQDLFDAEEQLAEHAIDPLVTIVTHHNFEFEWVGAAGKVLQLDNELEIINDDLQAGLQLTSAILTGEGPTYANAQIGLEAMIRRLDTFRRMLESFIENKIFKPIAKFNKFTSVDARGKETIIYPKFQFKPIDIKDKNQFITILLQLYDKGGVSLRTVHEKMDLDPDYEIEQIRAEEMSGLLISPDMGLGLSEGFGGVTGGGFGGGMGGMGAPGEMGAEAGLGGMGGMPGGLEGAGAPGGGAMEGGEGAGIPAAASTQQKNYKSICKLVREASKEFEDNVSICNLLDDEFTIEEDPNWLPTGPNLTYNQYLKQSTTIAQSLYRQAMKDDEITVPNNEGFIVEAAKNKKDKMRKRVLFTRIEQMLYKGVLESDISLDFYAQYIIGNNIKFKVDGAFPRVKVAIEADGDTWHNNDEAMYKDKRRDSVLASMGWVVLRFTDKEIEQKLPDVINVIKSVINKRLS